MIAGVKRAAAGIDERQGERLTPRDGLTLQEGVEVQLGGEEE
jgi:hypothetical protein